MITKPLKIWQMKPERPADFLIGEPSDPYMRRWWLIPRNDQFNVYYHEILKDDDDRALHDHPWPSFSICTRGGLIEVTEDGEREITPGLCVVRSPETAHRLKLMNPGWPAETLFITGPRVREWGFACPKGWVPWQEFVAPYDKGRVGRGCGEME